MKLKKILVVLIIVLISLISFGGIFIQKTKFVENILPEFKLETDLKGYRTIGLKVSSAIDDTFYDLEENAVEDNQKTTEESKDKEETDKEEKNNEDEKIFEEDLAKAEKIIKNRLNNFKNFKYNNIGISESKAANYYIIKPNSSTKKISLQIPENNSTDMIAQYIGIKGDFNISDEEGNILIDNSHIKNVEANYYSNENGISVYLTIEFNKQGKEILRDITNTFVETKDEEGNDTTKKVTLKIDETEMLTTYFDTEITDGKIQLVLGTFQEVNNDLIRQYQETSNLAVILNSGNLPLLFSLEENRYVKTDIDFNMLLTPTIIVSVLLALGIVYLIIKYKLNGIYAAISFIGYIALLLLIIRLTNTTLTLEGVTGIILSIMLNYMLVTYLLFQINKSQEEEKIFTYKNLFKQPIALVLISIIIIALISSFSGWLPIYSFGIATFWGIVCIIIYNLTITPNLIFEKK